MTWESFYLICFGVGLVLCLLSVATGGHRGHFHLGGHGHLAAPRVGAHMQHSTGGRGMPLLNGFTLTAFLCWFGGAGYLLRTHGSFPLVVVLVFAMLSGLAAAGLVSWFLSSVLLAHDRPLTAEETATVGVLGRVSGPLRGGLTGEILFSQLGARRSVPARSDDGSAIDRDAEVVVMRYEHGIAYVRRFEDLVSRLARKLSRRRIAHTGLRAGQGRAGRALTAGELCRRWMQYTERRTHEYDHHRSWNWRSCPALYPVHVSAHVSQGGSE